CGVAAHAQTIPQVQERPALGASMTVEALGTLPSSANLFSLLDTVVPDVIAGSASRVGAHGSTWTQTLFRVGDADVTNPRGTGAPLLIPGVKEWEQVNVATGLMPMDVSAPGMAVTLAPRRPAASWVRSVDLMGSWPALNAGNPSASPPAIARLNSWAYGNVFMSGPVLTSTPERLGILLSATLTRSSHFERDRPTVIDGNLASVFLNLVSAPSSADEIRFAAWGQRTRDAVPHHFAFDQPSAGEKDLGGHTQLAWQHRFADAHGGVRAFAAY